MVERPGRRLRHVTTCALGTAVLLATVAAGAGCSRKSVSGEETGTGMLTGYELGHEQDMMEVREERPDYRRPYE